MTTTEARIALNKLGWTELVVAKQDGQWSVRISRHNGRRWVWREVLAKTRRKAFDEIVLWAQEEAKKQK